MRSRFAAYVAASNQTFALTFPAAVVGAAALYYLSASWFWMAPAAIAVIEATAKAFDVWKRQRQR